MMTERYLLAAGTLVLDVLHVPHALVVGHQVDGVAFFDDVVACERQQMREKKKEKMRKKEKEKNDKKEREKE
jgi:hypothetical protein